jgi:hypothetical protein
MRFAGLSPEPQYPAQFDYARSIRPIFILQACGMELLPIPVKKQPYFMTTEYSPEEPVDVVYTWVDDRQPGYRELLQQHAIHKRDKDPARTRDNLDTLRYSLRSLQRHAPWINRIFILTCRPQIPSWLDISNPRISVVHHDQVMEAAYLPTFNSLAITCHLHLLPGLSRRFIYLEDDMLLLAPVTLNDFVAPDGLQYVFEERRKAPRLEQIANPEREGGWNLALAHSNALLDKKYGVAARSQVNHSPILIDKAKWEETLRAFPESLKSTLHSRFRAAGNFAPDYLYLQCLLAEGNAHLVGNRLARNISGYVPLEDFWPVTAWLLWKLQRQRPKWVTLNDNFGANPNQRAVAMMRRQLQLWFPGACEFERR